MKILAYGGNEYSIRTLIGEWPGISSEHLGDLYGIPSGSASFGLVFPGGSPALIYRERINPQYRGGYPYTVLLDLGPWEGADTLWSRAGWNAAGLLECMFGLNSPRRASFMTPENLSVGMLNSVVEEILKNRELDRFHQDSTALTNFGKKWPSFLAGSLNSASPVVAPPKALGSEQRPTMAEFASLSFHLPPWLRTGRGWMVGGSYTQAAGFGAAALLDDEPFGEKVDPSPIIRDGEQLRSSLEEMSASPSTAQQARELINKPAIDWPDPKQLFERTGLWRRAAGGDDSAFEQKLPEDGIFAAEIFAAAFDNALDKAAHQIRIGPHQTRAILESRRLFGPTRISRPLVRFLDRDTLSKQLDIEMVPPHIPEYLELTPEICLARSKSQLEAAKRDLSRADLENWRAFLRGTEAGDAEDDFLRDFVWRLPRLSTWKSNGDRKLSEILKQEAASRLKKGPANYVLTWLSDALFFLPKQEVNAEVEKLKGDLDRPLSDLVLQLQAEPREQGLAARQWLTDLAASDLRKRVGVETKIEIACENPRGWINLLYVCQSLRDGKPFAGEDVPKQEREVLAQECLDMLRLYAPSNRLRAPVQDFVRIAKLLDLQKRYAAELKALAANPPFRPYYEALQPTRKKTVIDASRSEPDAATLPDLFAEASKLHHAIGRFAKAMAASDRTIAPGATQDREPESYDDLADLLLIDWIRDKSTRAPSQEKYVRLPRKSAAAWTGIAVLATAAPVWYLRFHPRPIPVAGVQAFEQHPLALELAGAALAILGVALLIRGLIAPVYVRTFSKQTWDLLRASVANLLAQEDQYTKRRCGELIKGLSHGDPQKFKIDGSFDWLLLLYLGRDREITTRSEKVGSSQIKRVRRSAVFILETAGLIRKKGWFAK